MIQSSISCVITLCFALSKSSKLLISSDGSVVVVLFNVDCSWCRARYSVHVGSKKYLVDCLLFVILTIITDISDHPLCLAQTSGDIEVARSSWDRRMTAELIQSLGSREPETPGYP